MNTTPPPSPTIFDSFNARNLRPDQVAKTFIPPAHFARLCGRRHNLVIGPRGSGKTTLLKMLQLSALAAWDHPEASRYRSAVDYTAVFIAADISWGAQLDHLGDGLPPDIREKLGLCAFTTHVLISLTEAMRETQSPQIKEIGELSEQHCTLDPYKEDQLVSLVSKQWHLDVAIPSLQGLTFALRGRLADIPTFASQLSGLSPDDANKLLASKEWAHLEFLSSAIFAIDIFNSLTNKPGKKWAFLFDELEIAPEKIRKQLLMAIRSVDQRLLFKLSLSPYNHDFKLLQRAESAMSGEDYDPIELWYSHKEASYKFSNELVRAMIAGYGAGTRTPQILFGESSFDIVEEGESLPGYQPGSPRYHAFRKLAEQDSSFSRYLARQQIDLSRMHELSEEERASAIRKITPIVMVRNAFRAEHTRAGARRVVGRSRKNPIIYTGASSLFAIAEGNPRWIIGMLGPLIRDIAAPPKNVAAPPKNVSRSAQGEAISAASTRFRALLGTIPIGGLQARRFVGMLQLLDFIGEYFHKAIVLDDFTPEPPNTFSIDAQVPGHLIDALGKALNSGAVVHIPERPGEQVLGSLVGKRFRLSYMLAPHYKLPLSIGKARALSNVLGNSESTDRLV